MREVDLVHGGPERVHGTPTDGPPCTRAPSTEPSNDPRETTWHHRVPIRGGPGPAQDRPVRPISGPVTR